LANLAEYALGLDPTRPDPSPGSVVLNGSVLEYRYTRSLAAKNAGIVYLVEWSDTLAANDWSTAGVVETVLSASGDREEIKATVSPTGSRRFMRLRFLGI
jgi:hypothetical protein